MGGGGGLAPHPRHTLALAPPRHPASDLSTVVGPMEDGLALPPAAREVALLAIVGDGLNVPDDSSPASDLAAVVGRAPPGVIPAVPLKPATRILRVNPAVAPPRPERL